MDERYLRQQALVSQDKLGALSVAVIGCGAVGSFTALSLVKMGIQHITLYDNDSVEVHNLPNQFYRESDLGRPKVAATADILAQIDSKAEVRTVGRQFIAGRFNTDIVISAVDSMQARQVIWRAARRDPRVSLFIDPRMGGWVVQLYSAVPKDKLSADRYEATLISDTDAYQERCTARAIIFSAMPLAALVCRAVALHANGEWLEPALTFDNKTLTLMQTGVSVPQ